MPPKYSALPEWVVPFLHFAGTMLGYTLLAVVGVLAYRKWRWATWIVTIIIVITNPFLLESLYDLNPSRHHLLPISWSGAVQAVCSGYEILGVILAVWLGTIWYRNNLGNQF